MLGLATIGLAVALRRLRARLVESVLVAVLGLGFAIAAFRIDRGSTTGGGPVLTWLTLVAVRCLELSRAGSEAASAAPAARPAT